MRLDTSQQMRTDMRLRMAPRMIQSMEILQLPLMALQERIDQELSENPVLIDLREAPCRRPTPRKAPTPEQPALTEFPQDGEPDPESSSEAVPEDDWAELARRGAADEPRRVE